LLPAAYGISATSRAIVAWRVVSETELGRIVAGDLPSRFFAGDAVAGIDLVPQQPEIAISMAGRERELRKGMPDSSRVGFESPAIIRSQGCAR
jgi:hypothetical protein